MSTSKEDNCPRDGLTVRMVTRYIIKPGRLIYESQYFIRVSFECPVTSGKPAVLSDEDVQRRNIASVRRCNVHAAFSRRKIYGLRGTPCRENRWTIIRYNRDGEIVDIAARARLDRQGSIRRDLCPSLIQRDSKSRDIALPLYFCPVVYNPRAAPIVARGSAPKIEMKRKKSRRRDGTGYALRASYLAESREWSPVIYQKPAAGISQISGLMAPVLHPAKSLDPSSAEREIAGPAKEIRV